MDRRSLLLWGAAIPTMGAVPASTRAGRSGGQPVRNIPRPIGDGLTDDRDALAFLDRELHAAEPLRLTSGSYRIGSNLEFSRLVVMEGGNLLIPDGVTVRFKEGISAPPVQIFTCSGTGRVTFAKGIVGYPEWWGARPGAPDFDSLPSLQACVDACAITQLSGAGYYTSNTLHILKNGRSIVGSGFTQNDQKFNDSAGASRLICTSPSVTIIQIGRSDSRDPRHEHEGLIEAAQLTGFTIDRSVAPFTTYSDVLGAIGVALRWCVNCHLELLFSLNSARGFALYGAVSCFFERCSALREVPGSNKSNDTFVGWYFDQNAPAPYNGGNASIYLNRCRAFPGTENGTPPLTYSAGVRFDGGWVDTFITQLEVGGGIHYGVHGVGDGVSASTYRTENLQLIDCVLDPGAVANVCLEQAGPLAAVTINGGYMAPGAGGTAMLLKNFAGSVAVNHVQLISTEPGATGIRAIHSNNLASAGNIFTNISQPLVLSECTNFSLQDTINNRLPGTSSAVTITDSVRGRINCIISGVPGSFSGGVDLRGNTTNSIEVELTNTNPDAIAGGAANKLRFEGTQIRAEGPFGRNCVARGLLS